MLKYYIKASEALKDFRKDQAGVVSFEYVIVAFCIVTAVVAVFGTGTGGAVQGALNTAMTNVLSAFTAGTGG